MPKTVQHKRGTAAIMTANNPVLAAGEIGIETDTLRIKIGDGSTAWNSLSYQAPSASDITLGTLTDTKLSTKAQSALSLYLWSNFK